jgi:hypothetical protein
MRLMLCGTLPFLVLIFSSCASCKSVSTVNAPRASPAPQVNLGNANITVDSAKYFDGSKACKFLADVNGLDLGVYVPYTNTAGHHRDGGERSITLSCNPVSDILCNKISYEVNGEEQGATRGQLFYMGTSLHAQSHKRDMQAFVRYCGELTKQALGQELNAEMKQYILNTSRFLAMAPAPERDALERHTLKRSLGSGVIRMLTRKNELPGGTAYMIFCEVYPDEYWIDR